MLLLNNREIPDRSTPDFFHDDNFCVDIFSKMQILS